MNKPPTTLERAEAVALELQVRRQLARRVVSLQQCRVLEVILERSFGWENYGLRVPSQATLAQLADMKEEHVCTVVKELSMAFVLCVVKTPEFVEYRIIVDSQGWMLERRPDLRSLDEELQRFNRVEQVLLLPRDKSLKEVIADNALDQVNEGSHRDATTKPDLRFSLRAKTGVTEKVTPTLINTDKSLVTSLTASTKNCLTSESVEKDSSDGHRRAAATGKTDWELVNKIKEIVGPKQWEDDPGRDFRGWGGWWVSVVRNNRDRAEAALNELTVQRREGTHIPNPGGWMMDYVKRLAEAERKSAKT